MRKYCAIIFGGYVAWIVFWLSVGVFAAWRQKVATDLFLEASVEKDQVGMQVGNESSQYFADWIETALIWGALWPIPIMLALIAFGLVFKRISKLG